MEPPDTDDVTGPVVATVRELGYVARRADLLRLHPVAAIDRALRRGLLVADARGRYCLPGADDAIRLAHALSGVLCLTSAALAHGWEVREAPDLPHVLVPRKRKVPPGLRERVHLHRGDLHADDVTGPVTTVEQTLTQCLRRLPYADALSVADSALRHGVLPAVLRSITVQARGPGSPRIRRVAAAARAEAANPFESSLRACTHEVSGLHAEPQVRIRTAEGTVRPDLVDVDLGLVAEADSFAWHGDRAALRADARRYDRLAAEGWLVLRFAWEDVMFDPAWVVAVLRRAVATRVGRTEVGPSATEALHLRAVPGSEVTAADRFRT